MEIRAACFSIQREFSNDMSVFCLLICLWVCIHSGGAALADYYWKDFSFGDIPYDAVEVADDGKYIGQTYVDDGLLPVTIYPHFAAAIGQLYGKIVATENVQILCTPEPTRLYWDLVDFNKPADGQLKNAIIGGFYKKEFIYFIGKAYHDEEWKVSKVIPIGYRSKGLLVWDPAGKAITISKFHLLKYNSTNSSSKVPTCSD